MLQITPQMKVLVAVEPGARRVPAGLNRAGTGPTFYLSPNEGSRGAPERERYTSARRSAGKSETECLRSAVVLKCRRVR